MVTVLVIEAEAAGKVAAVQTDSSCFLLWSAATCAPSRGVWRSCTWALWVVLCHGSGWCGAGSPERGGD